MIGLLRRKRREKREEDGGERPGGLGVAPYRRLVIDGVELLVRRIISINEEEVVYEDPMGNIRTFRRKKRLLGLF